MRVDLIRQVPIRSYTVSLLHSFYSRLTTFRNSIRRVCSGWLNIGKHNDDSFTLENPVPRRSKRRSHGKWTLRYIKDPEPLRLPSHSVSSRRATRTTGKYTLNEICIIIRREKLLFTRAGCFSPLLGRAKAARRLAPRRIGRPTMRVINARVKRERQGKESTT